MATGVLVLGLGRATRLLGHLALTEKEYEATIRLGATTLTDDADGDVLERRSAAAVEADDVRTGAAALTGDLLQVPAAVSAVKVEGRRAYARVRAGEEVALSARPVRVTAFEVRRLRRPEPDLLDVDVRVVCSSGTYVRALARDLGAGLGVGGHLTALRRTRVGPFAIGSARTLEQLAGALDVLPLAAAVDAAFPRVDVGEEQAAGVRHGRPLPLPEGGPTGPCGVFGPDGAVLALMVARGPVLRPLVVFA
jgi:tRNA pseudouridine55 synthase